MLAKDSVLTWLESEERIHEVDDFDIAMTSRQ